MGGPSPWTPPGSSLAGRFDDDAHPCTLHRHGLGQGGAAARAGEGPRRRTAIFRPDDWTGPLPIHCWLIEHPDGPILVDAGEVATVGDLPFVRFAISREDEVDAGLARIGVAPGDLRRIVLTHSHSDHVDGLVRLPGCPVSIGARELRFARAAAAVPRRIVHTPLPPGFDPAPLRFEPVPFGAFGASVSLTSDGAVVAVPTPGHTPGHISVVVVIDGLHHFLAGDATYDQAQLLGLEVDGIAPRGRVARATMRTILRHAALHPTVYLPTHDADAAVRLRDGVLVRV